MKKRNFEKWFADTIEGLNSSSNADDETKAAILKSYQGVKTIVELLDKKADELELTKEESYILGYLILKSIEDENFRSVSAKDFSILNVATMIYIHKNKDETLELFDAAKRLAFISSLSIQDLETAKIKDAAEKLKQLKKCDNESIDDVLDVLGYGTAISLYRKKRSIISSKPAKTFDNIRTRRPTQFITPVDKVSNKTFDNGILYSPQPLAVALEKRGSKKPISAMVSLNFDEFERNGAQIGSRKQLTTYDREVHDAITTLSVDGGNEYITGQMIYQTMVGDSNARLNPKQAETISNSITKLMYSKLRIDATEEAKAFGFESFKYDGSVVPAERVTVSINGTTVECIHLFRTPPLYEYADRKNQIGRVDIKLLNSPINKSEEVITLQGYLTRRVLAMKSSKLSPTIIYDTIYKQLEISSASDGALRKKKLKVRDQVKKILDYWKEQHFISGYTENSRGKEIYSVTIRIDAGNKKQ